MVKTNENEQANANDAATDVDPKDTTNAANQEPTGDDPAVVAVRDEYKAVTGNEVAAWYKNNVERMQKKIQEAKDKAEKKAAKEAEKNNKPTDPEPTGDDPKEVEPLKYYKVVKGTIKWVSHKAKQPYVQMTATEAGQFGKKYVEQKAHDEMPPAPKDED